MRLIVSEFSLVAVEQHSSLAQVLYWLGGYGGAEWEYHDLTHLSLKSFKSKAWELKTHPFWSLSADFLLLKITIFSLRDTFPLNVSEIMRI